MNERQHASVVTVNRVAETAAFLVGVLALGFHMIIDSLLHLGVRMGKCDPITVSGIPWAVIVGSAVLIAPKMLGRATAGQIILAGIQAITLRLSGRGAATASVSTQRNGETSKSVSTVSLPEEGGTAITTTLMQDATPDPSLDVEIAKAGKALDLPEAAP